MTAKSSHYQGGDQARASVSVRVPIAEAFRLFTEEIDRWWRRGPKFRHAGSRAGFVRIEPGVGGRVFESIDDAHGASVFEIGRIAIWDPPHRLLFSWRIANFAPDEITEVEVRFSETRGNTTVEVTHRGWSSLGADHPARHGLQGAAFVRMMGLWWGDQFTSLREVVRETVETAGRPDR